MKKEHLRLFTPITEGLPEKGYYLTIHKTGYVIYSFFNGEEWIGSTGNALEHISRYLDLSKLTTKSLAEQLANDIGNFMLVDRTTKRSVNSSNEIAQLVIDRKTKL